MTAEPQADTLLVSAVVGLLNDAENYAVADVGGRLGYLDRRAALLHRLVDATGDEASRYLAQDAEDRADRVRSVAEALAGEATRRPHRGARSNCSRRLVAAPNLSRVDLSATKAERFPP
ncbi:hypothetical protein [Streptomyces sp. MMS24-I29]|uniref:hypothetical protein n=1 Tax=Streptomyces sp. MMS24-I29 TaxID=3351480 RepID=UPI003C7EBC6B